MSTFRFNPRPTTWVTVRLNVPTEDGPQVQTFRARFLILPQEERNRLGALDGKAGLEQVWLDWQDIADIDGKPIPYSDALRAELLEFDYVMMGVADAYARAMMGIEAKN